MKKHIILWFMALCLLCISRCTAPQRKIFNADNLATQTFEVDVSKDTVITTAGGLSVFVKQGSLSSPNGNKVVLRIKEALALTDIMRAGLSTTSNKELLSTGGMFLIEPEDASVRIISPISVGVPADFIEEVSLYKGELNDNGKINWVKPEPVPVKENPSVTNGEALFKSNCATCHAIGKGIVIGPDLAHIVKRRDGKWLFEYTKDSQGFSYGFDTAKDSIHNPENFLEDFYAYYSKCLFEHFNRTVMTSFKLSYDELHQLYDYIEDESNRQRLPMPKDELFHCTDSCFQYSKEKVRLQYEREKLIQDNGALLQRKNIIPPQQQSAGTPAPGAANPVQTADVRATYYKVDITTFGWYNIDILLKNMIGVVNSNLIVQLTGMQQNNVSVFIVIPSHKVYAEGGKLDTGENNYGFFDKDGTIPLPQNRTVYVYAVGEAGDQLVFGSAEFKASPEQKISVAPVAVTKDELEASIKKMGAGGFEANVSQSKNAEEIKSLDKKIDAAEKLKPKNCDCNCAGSGEGFMSLK